jgi:Ca2+-binding EF-hand superfamily protein
LNLLQKFRKIDRNRKNTISKKEFRATIESHFSIELNDSEFNELMFSVPCNSENQVEYLEFMTKFDTDNSSTLFDTASVKYV